MTKFIGWTFVLLSPFFGASLVLSFAYHLLTGNSWELLFGVISVVWVLAYCLWFDGSKYQRNLI